MPSTQTSPHSHPPKQTKTLKQDNNQACMPAKGGLVGLVTCAPNTGGGSINLPNPPPAHPN